MELVRYATVPLGDSVTWERKCHMGLVALRWLGRVRRRVSLAGTLRGWESAES